MVANLHPTRTKEMLFQQSLINSKRRGVIGAGIAENVRSPFVDELTVDCMAEPQHRIFERELLRIQIVNFNCAEKGNEKT